MKSFDLHVAGPPDIVFDLLRTALKADEQGKFSFGVSIPGHRRISGQVAGALVLDDDGVQVVGTSGVELLFTAVMLGAGVLGSIMMVSGITQRGFHLDALWSAWFGQSVFVWLLYFLYAQADTACGPAGERRVAETVDEVRQMLEAYCIPEDVSSPSVEHAAELLRP
ncbi:MAG: hypothetical protein KC621_32470 [Myxococcales bacterium]|nr:hypothetical protein [Myxococcales bacterium]